MTLKKKVLSKLLKKKIKVAVAESCTGGMLSSSLTSLSGSSKIFSMGIVSYSNKSKISVLKVPKKIINKFGAVSAQCCISMVNNLSKISNSELNMSITGIAGPNGGSKIKPVGLVYIGIKYKGKISINKFNINNKNRIFIQRTTVKKSLELILKTI